jgi:methyl-accepting chemotaxis protein
MHTFNNLKIGKKLILTFSAVLALVIALSSVTFIELNAITRSTDDLADVRLPSIAALRNVQYIQAARRAAVLSHVISTEDADMKALDERIADLLAEREKARASYEPLIASPEERALYQKYVDLLGKYDKEVDAILSLSRQNQNERAKELTGGNARILSGEMSAALESAVKLNTNNANISAVNTRNAASLAQTLLMAGLAVVCALLIGAGLALKSSIATPIVAITHSMSDLAKGNKTIEIPNVGREDEVGAMASAVLVFKENAIEADRLAGEREAARIAREKRAEAIETMTREFDAKVSQVLGIVSGACTEMDSTAQSLSATAEQTNRQATAVAAASEEASSSVQTVASAAEELSASIVEIGRQVEHAKNVSHAATEEANRADKLVQGLSEGSSRIGEVINLITDIASQTNLLALNATIEAARAGEMGKGFAVVAGEVKNLANQTAKATEEIGAQIGAVQSATSQVVTAIGSIVARIGEIAEVNTVIAAAVEQQQAAAHEIARNVQNAAAGTQEISSTTVGVSQAAGETGAASRQVLDASRSLSQEAESLRGVVETFLSGVRSA